MPPRHRPDRQPHGFGGSIVAAGRCFDEDHRHHLDAVEPDVCRCRIARGFATDEDAPPVIDTGLPALTLEQRPFEPEPGHSQRRRELARVHRARSQIPDERLGQLRRPRGRGGERLHRTPRGFLGITLRPRPVVATFRTALLDLSPREGIGVPRLDAPRSASRARVRRVHLHLTDAALARAHACERGRHPTVGVRPRPERRNRNDRVEHVRQLVQDGTRGIEGRMVAAAGPQRGVERLDETGPPLDHRPQLMADVVDRRLLRDHRLEQPAASRQVPGGVARERGRALQGRSPVGHVAATCRSSVTRSIASRATGVPDFFASVAGPSMREGATTGRARGAATAPVESTTRSCSPASAGPFQTHGLRLYLTDNAHSARAVASSGSSSFIAVTSGQRKLPSGAWRAASIARSATRAGGCASATTIAW